LANLFRPALSLQYKRGLLLLLLPRRCRYAASEISPDLFYSYFPASLFDFSRSFSVSLCAASGQAERGTHTQLNTKKL